MWHWKAYVSPCISWIVRGILPVNRIAHQAPIASNQATMPKKNAVTTAGRLSGSSSSVRSRDIGAGGATRTSTLRPSRRCHGNGGKRSSTRPT